MAQASLIFTNRYRAAGHPASAVALLEAAVREHEEGLGFRHRGITALTRRTEEWFEDLPPSDASELRLRVRHVSVAAAVGAMRDCVCGSQCVRLEWQPSLGICSLSHTLHFQYAAGGGRTAAAGHCAAGGGRLCGGASFRHWRRRKEEQSGAVGCRRPRTYADSCED